MLEHPDVREADTMKLLAYIPALLAIVLHVQLASANSLYQWTGKDGTPTYSPDPPPKGVQYTIVGPDLQPLTGQPAATSPNQNINSGPTQLSLDNVTEQEPVENSTPKKNNVVIAPTPKSLPQEAPKTEWKPVKYADAPSSSTNQPVLTGKAVATASISSPVSTISDQCLSIKQQLLILEGQFANAQTAQEMDQAVLRLSNLQKSNRDQCGL